MFINYYDELGLSSEYSIGKLNEELVKIEKLWVSRQVNKPDEANKYLFFINEAKKVFKSENTKKSYDNELIEFKKKNDEEKQSDQEDEEQNGQEDKEESIEENEEQKFNDLLAEAEKFLDLEQYDLAVKKVDELLCTWDEESYDYYSLAKLSYIYYRNKQTSTALQYIDKSLLKNPEYSFAYRYRYYYLLESEPSNTDKLNNTLNAYIKKTEDSGSSEEMVDAYEFVAYQKYYYLSCVQEAREFCEKTIYLDPDNETAKEILGIIINNDDIDYEISSLIIPSNPYENKAYNIATNKFIMVPLWFIIIFFIFKKVGFGFIILVTIGMAFGPRVWARYKIKEISKLEQKIEDLKTKYK